MESTLDWARLGRYVRNARGARSQKDITENGGPSDETLSKIEHGKWQPKRSVKETLEKLDVGLGWAPGSSEIVLRGGAPITRARRTPDDSGNVFVAYQQIAAAAKSKLAAVGRTGRLVDMWRHAQPLTRPDVLIASGGVEGLTDAVVTLARNVAAFTEDEVGGYTRMQSLAQSRVTQIDNQTGQQTIFDSEENQSAVEASPQSDAPTEGEQGEEVNEPGTTGLPDDGEAVPDDWASVGSDPGANRSEDTEQNPELG